MSIFITTKKFASFKTFQLTIQSKTNIESSTIISNNDSTIVRISNYNPIVYNEWFNNKK